MKTAPLRVFVALSMIFLWSQNAFAARDNDMKLTIASDKQVYKKDEPISIDFKLKNTGKKEVYVNKRFYITPEDAKVKNGEVYFSVTSPSGEKLPCKTSYETGLPKTDYFALLKPGEEIAIERKPVMNYFFDFSVLGDYKITAVYQNRYGEEIGLDVFKDKVESRPISIKRVD